MTMTTEFRDAIQGLRATRADRNSTAVVEALDRHGREEGELLRRYQRFVDDSQPPAVRYLVRLILEDEQRHHRVLEDLANTIAWGSVSSKPEQVVPPLPVTFQGDAALRSETKALLRLELRDRTELRRLRRRLHRYGDVAMWRFLIDLMRSDTAKHIRILRFILANETSSKHLGWAVYRLGWQRL